ncbi:protein INCA1-like [Polypterus senegalus]|uniref:protein INCA1-like n=1 Tax=Polypterus senegalus TaxID=55291 RepID=UPI0019631FF4|nr:protein INCA1-like [Polypterus senegalus]
MLPGMSAKEFSHQYTEDIFLPFAKKSKSVTRSDPSTCGPSLQSPASLVSYTDDFFKQPSCNWKEDYRDATSAMMSSAEVHRPHLLRHLLEMETFVPSAKGETHREKLPSPAELYGKKRTSGQRAVHQKQRLESVLCHIEELKRRQLRIDILKEKMWGVSRNIHSIPVHEKADIPEQESVFLVPKDNMLELFNQEKENQNASVLLQRSTVFNTEMSTQPNFHLCCTNHNVPDEEEPFKFHEENPVFLWSPF